MRGLQTGFERSIPGNGTRSVRESLWHVVSTFACFGRNVDEGRSTKVLPPSARRVSANNRKSTLAFREWLPPRDLRANMIAQHLAR